MADQQEVRFTRIYDAPRELVWRAWTEPEQLARWWGTTGWGVEADTIVADAREGGAFRVKGVRDDGGAEMETVGVYREVSPPERLVLEEPAEGNWHDGALNTLTLTDLGDGRTQMDIVTVVNTSDEMKSVMEGGMTVSFDRLGDHLAGEVAA
jgi:uncharacterized protein YndB with AHSA1/START domain